MTNECGTTILTQYMRRKSGSQTHAKVPLEVLQDADELLRKHAEQFQRGVDAASHKLTGEVIRDDE